MFLADATVNELPCRVTVHIDQPGYGHEVAPVNGFVTLRCDAGANSTYRVTLDNNIDMAQIFVLVFLRVPDNNPV